MLNIISCEFLEEIIYNLILNEGREIYNENGTFNRFQIDDTDYDNLSIYEAQKKALNNIKDQKGVEYKNLDRNSTYYIEEKLIEIHKPTLNINNVNCPDIRDRHKLDLLAEEFLYSARDYK